MTDEWSFISRNRFDFKHVFLLRVFELSLLLTAVSLGCELVAISKELV